MPRPRYGISRSALKTAWKMVETIFVQFRIPAQDQDKLLTLITIASLFDLLDWVVRWRKSPPPSRLVFYGREVNVVPSSESYSLHDGWSDQDVDSAIEAAEAIMDRFDLPEEERATLYTALPCLGTHALRNRLIWMKKPPFPEVN